MPPLKTLSVFFPAYNEEDNIAITVSQAIEVLKTLELTDYEVIVVDDGSTDKTAAVAQGLASKNSKIRLVRHHTNRGYGAALKTGFSSAKFDWIAFSDSDGQFDFQEINKFLDHIPNYQVIAGYRKKRSDSKFRRMMAFLLRVWDTVLFGLNLKDVDCGFKLIKKSVIDKVFPLVTESAITETEMMAKIHRAGFPIKQIGVTHHSRTGGVQTGGNFKVIFKAIIESIKLFLHFNPSLPILTAILLAAAWLRLYRIRDYLVFLGDEGRDMLVWFNMVSKGEFTFLGPTASVGGFYLGPVYYYLALPFYFLTRDPVGPAIFVALTGIATVFLVWYTAKKWFGNIAGLTAGWMYTVAALIIRYSRASWNPNPVPFFSLLGLYLATGSPKDKHYRLKLLGAGVCLGILWQLHYLTLILTPIFTGVVIVSVVFKGPALPRQGRALINSFIGLGALALGWVIGFSPFLAFEIYHNFPNTRTVIEFTFRPGGGVLNFEPLGLIRSITRNINRLFYTVESWRDKPLIQLITALVVLGGTTAAISRKKLSLLIWFYLGITIFSLYQGNLADYYFGFLFPAPFLLFGALSQSLWDRFRPARPLLLLIPVFFTLDQSKRWFINQQPNRLLRQTQSVAQQVIDLSNRRPYNFALITYGNSDHAYRYFLEKFSRPPSPLKSQVADQLIAVCEKPQPQCQPLGNPIWEIAGFGRAEIDTQATIPPGITVYRLIHYTNDR